jgi:diguanylate cyclase (GGDEF)-like protein
VAAEQDGGYLVAERIRRRWQDESFEWQGIHSNFTVSIGVAQLHSEDDTVDGMLERAERGLASAKQAGRNCVIVHTGDGAAA